MLRSIRFSDLRYIKELTRHFRRNYDYVRFDTTPNPTSGYELTISNSKNTYIYGLDNLNKNIQHLAYFVVKMLDLGFNIKIRSLNYIDIGLPRDMVDELCHYLDPFILGKLSLTTKHSGFNIDTLIHNMAQIYCTSHKYFHTFDVISLKSPDGYFLSKLFKNNIHLQAIKHYKNCHMNYAVPINFVKTSYKEILYTGCREENVAKLLCEQISLDELLNIIDKSPGNNSVTLHYLVKFKRSEFINHVNNTARIYSKRVFRPTTWEIFFKTSDWIDKYYVHVIENSIERNYYSEHFKFIINEVDINKLLAIKDEVFIRLLIKYIKITKDNLKSIVDFYTQTDERKKLLLERLNK